MKNKNEIAPAIFVIYAVLLTVSGLLISCSSRKEIKGEEKQTVIAKKQYVCSMHPQIVQDTPGDCPICGMLLIEKIADDKNSGDTSLNSVVLHVNHSVLSSVSKVKPVLATLPVTIEASGIVTFDPRRIRTISARANGVVDRSFVKYEFQSVQKGQKIFQVYCPDIYIEKWNYVLQIRAFPDQDNLTVEAREWFKLLGLTPSQLDSLKKSDKPDYHLMVYSDYSGNVVRPDFNPDTYFLSGNSEENGSGESLVSGQGIGLNDGVTIERGASLFKLVDPTYLRVDFKVRTEDIKLLKTGQTVSITNDGTGEEKLSGTISQIEPFNGGFFQIVRVYLTDSRKILQPGRQIRGLFISGVHEAMWLPETAVLDLGRGKSVFLFRDGKFVATPVETGMKNKDMIEIISGIDSDSEIALNGLLLIDSDGFISSR
jgi:Cu(I)/Ag(I) efflux system membrane fusion protein